MPSHDLGEEFERFEVAINKKYDENSKRPSRIKAEEKIDFDAGSYFENRCNIKKESNLPLRSSVDDTMKTYVCILHLPAFSSFRHLQFYTPI